MDFFCCLGFKNELVESELSIIFSIIYFLIKDVVGLDVFSFCLVIFFLRLVEVCK